MKTHRFGSKRNPGLHISGGHGWSKPAANQPVATNRSTFFQHEMSDWNITRPSLEI